MSRTCRFVIRRTLSAHRRSIKTLPPGYVRYSLALLVVASHGRSVSIGMKPDRVADEVRAYLLGQAGGRKRQQQQQQVMVGVRSESLRNSKAVQWLHGWATAALGSGRVPTVFSKILSTARRLPDASRELLQQIFDRRGTSPPTQPPGRYSQDLASVGEAIMSAIADHPEGTTTLLYGYVLGAGGHVPRGSYAAVAPRCRPGRSCTFGQTNRRVSFEALLKQGAKQGCCWGYSRFEKFIRVVRGPLEILVTACSHISRIMLLFG